MKTQELAQIEFRYLGIPKNENYTKYKNKVITIGVFDDFEQAIKESNKVLEVFESHFKLNSAYNKKERFGKNNGCFGSATRVITNLAYLKTPFEFYFKIQTLYFEDASETILNVCKSVKDYKNHEKQQKED